MDKTKIEKMSDDVSLYNDIVERNIETMSGDIDLKNCKENKVETMSGDVTLTESSVQDIETMSGDVTLTKSGAGDISTMSGNVKLYDSDVCSVETMSGKLTIKDSVANYVTCQDYCLKDLSGAKINKLTILDKNSTTIKGDGINISINNISISGNIFDIFKKGKEEISEVTLPDDSQVDEVIFKGKGIVYSSYEVKTNGELKWKKLSNI